MQFSRIYSTIESHTAGEPLRIVTGGDPADSGSDHSGAAALGGREPGPRAPCPDARAAGARRYVWLLRHPARHTRRRPGRDLHAQ